MTSRLRGKLGPGLEMVCMLSVHQAKEDCYSLTSPIKSVPEIFHEGNHPSQQNCDQYMCLSTPSTLRNGQNYGSIWSHEQRLTVNLDSQGLD